MRVKCFYWLAALVSFCNISYGQVAADFDIYCYPSRFDINAKDYFENNGFITSNIDIMTQGGIVFRNDHTNFDPARVKRFLDKKIPDIASEGMLVLDWETGPYLDLRKYPADDPRFQEAEGKLIALLHEVRSQRPQLMLSYYGIPYRAWNEWQKANYNPAGKFDRLLSEVDFISPSLYILYADEEVEHTSNLTYLKDNLDVALAYGKKFQKPVIPFVWHRVHASNDDYSNDIIQKDIFANYIKYIATYELDSHKASGVYWWDNNTGRLNNLKGINGHLNGSVYDAKTYDAMIVDYAKTVKQVLE
jgi:hypothetical protein